MLGCVKNSSQNFLDKQAFLALGTSAGRRKAASSKNRREAIFANGSLRVALNK